MELTSWFRRDRFAAGAGARLVEIGPGYARARMRVTARQRNATGVAMGGAVFTLADLAFAACSGSRGRVAVAIQASISFLRPGSGLLTAEAREISRSTRLSTCEVAVTDAGGQLVASFHGIAFVKEQELPLPRKPRRQRRAPASPRKPAARSS